MECPRCHAENNDSSRFCSSCAAPLGAGAGSEAASLTKTLETPVQVVRPGTIIAGKYRIAEELGRGGKRWLCRVAGSCRSLKRKWWAIEDLNL